MNRVTAYLTADHERLHALLERAGAGEMIDREAFALFRAGLLRHIAIEEKVLMPAARNARAGEPLSRAHELKIDHAAISSLLVPTPDVALCAELVSILTPHGAKEEGPDGVYAECERLLSASESDELAARAAAFPEIRVSPHFDGPTVYRTAASALASASRLTRSGRKVSL
jgi:hypothetical protein